MAVLTPQVTDYNGTEVVYTPAASGGDKAPASDRLVVHIKNGGSNAITVTFSSPKPCDQGFAHHQPVTVDAGEDRFVGPFTRRFWTTDNYVEWTYSAVTNVTVAALR